MRVLLIEDNRADATLIQLAFGQVEPMIEIRWVTTAEEGLRALEIDNDAYHLVLLDLGLPRMSGAQFMAELARHGRPKKTPVMILSGTPGSQIVGVPTGDRPVGYLTKPVDLAGYFDIAKFVSNGLYTSDWTEVAGVGVRFKTAT